MRDHIEEMLRAGLLPVPATKKSPIIKWAGFYDAKPSDETVLSWGWGKHNRVCLITGEPSGGLEAIDFDQGGAAFEPWANEVKRTNPELFAKLVIQQTQGGGKHVIYRASNHEPNQKLAHDRAGNVLIETRGSRGVIVAAPTEGYKLIQGSWADVQYIQPAYRNWLIQTARACNVYSPPQPERTHEWKRAEVDERPGDRFNRENRTLDILARHGWTVEREDTRQYYLLRPGKAEGHSATLLKEDDTVWIFSSNAGALQEGRNYDAYGAWVHLEHGGDFAAASRELADQQRGQEIPEADDAEEFDISGLLHDANKSVAPTMPDVVWQEMPWVMRLAHADILDGAFKPQPELSLGALIAFFGAVVGRRVADRRNTRTNFLVLNLAPSGEGKEYPRQWIKAAMGQADCTEIEGPEQFGSHAGIVSALTQNAVKLFQVDEIGRLLTTMSSPKNPHLYQIGTHLLTLFSSAGTAWTSPAYADLAKVKRIEQPHMCLHGASTPDVFLGAINSEAISGGLIGRTLVFQGGSVQAALASDEFADDPVDLEAQPGIEVDQQVLDWVRYWRNQRYHPQADARIADEQERALESDLTKRVELGFLDFYDWPPAPVVVRWTGEAKRLLSEYQQSVDARRLDETELRQAIWARSVEKVAKLALLHAVCDAAPIEDGGGIEEPLITPAAIRWAKGIVNYSNRLITHATTTGVGDSQFMRNLKRVYGAWDFEESRRNVQRHRFCAGMRPFEFAECIEALEQMGLISVEKIATGSRGRPSIILRKTGEKPPW